MLLNNVDYTFFKIMTLPTYITKIDWKYSLLRFFVFHNNFLSAA